MIVVFVTGGREWKDREALRAVLSGYPPGTWLVHGGCRGADLMAAHVGMNFGFQEIRMDAPWGYYNKRAGPIRNRAMGRLIAALRDAGAQVDCYACHNDLENSRGTKDMIEVLGKHGFTYQLITSAKPVSP